ncbi:MAG: hypothetical protein UT19_C0001G0075 [Candidatus Woesebacteria bacterium GW2011_GWB1_39_10b]|uniref:Uncharacterized protein n=2 Tax=Candidatus Woeseibacteriota TaxID=1752722 RepID=A0A0G0PYQ4_9BACT|nr:MAG: hypothetical protein UT19_C0001G0075 [Candidatus Woesebacteria bacterium GW2011_GWB1_39_10b]
MDLGGVEPPTSSLQMRCSNQLNFRPLIPSINQTLRNLPLTFTPFGLELFVHGSRSIRRRVVLLFLNFKVVKRKNPALRRDYLMNPIFPFKTHTMPACYGLKLSFGFSLSKLPKKVKRIILQCAIPRQRGKNEWAVLGSNQRPLTYDATQLRHVSFQLP